MVMHNFTKVCMHYINSCDSTLTVDDCVRQELDANSDVTTPGQIELAQESAVQRRKNNAIIGAVLGAFCGTVLLLLALALLLRHYRRQRRQAHQSEQKLLPSPPTTGSDSSPDVELGLADSTPCSNSPAHPKAGGSPGTPPNAHNSWELAACKTSERFLHLQPQQAHQNNSSADVQQHWLPGNGAGGSWYMRAPGSSSNNVQSHDGAPSTADLIAGHSAGNDRVTLGVLLGAGESTPNICVLSRQRFAVEASRGCTRCRWGGFDSLQHHVLVFGRLPLFIRVLANLALQSCSNTWHVGLGVCNLPCRLLWSCIQGQVARHRCGSQGAAAQPSCSY